MKARWLLLLAVVALAFPAGAAAHGGVTQVAAVTVCGTTCRPLLPPLELFHYGRSLPHAVPTRPAPPGPYYRIDLLLSRPPPAFFVPSTGALRSFPDPFGVGNPTWLRLDPRVEAKLRAALRGLEPLPAPTIARATVDGQAVADPQDYLALYGARPGVNGKKTGGHHVIRLFGDELNPWADGYNRLEADDSGLLVRDGDAVRATPAMTKLVREPSFTRGRPSRAPWLPALASGAVALVLSAAFVRRLAAR
jgi:hypothetical protein